ncbi:MAG: helix-turn-helix domain-containing protein, partial [Pseudonocardiaceae bacterium]
MDAEEARTIGWALWRVRDDRGKSLRVIAGLAGMSKDTLNRIERGELSPTLNQILALAEALQISVSELTRLPVPAPANGETDSTKEAVRLALMAVNHGYPGGVVLAVEMLRARVTAMVGALCRCEQEREVGAALPGLIRDLHASIAAGRDVAELLGLSAWLHTQATVPWLRLAGDSLDLREQAIMLAGQAAGEHGTPAPIGLVAAAGASV